MLLYTDGVTDARAADGERFDDERLLATIEASGGGTAQDVVNAICGAVNAFQVAVEPADDITIVAIGPAQARGTPGRRLCQAGGPPARPGPERVIAAGLTQLQLGSVVVLDGGLATEL